MKIFRIMLGVLIVGFVMTCGPEIEERIFLSQSRHLVPTAEARIGRPLTPVSVAGVARRTVRRCAVGVYHCGLPEIRSLNNLQAQKTSESIPLKRQPEAS